MNKGKEGVRVFGSLASSSGTSGRIDMVSSLNCGFFRGTLRKRGRLINRSQKRDPMVAVGLFSGSGLQPGVCTRVDRAFAGLR